jgi:hypothetical protein
MQQPDEPSDAKKLSDAVVVDGGDSDDFVGNDVMEPGKLVADPSSNSGDGKMTVLVVKVVVVVVSIVPSLILGSDLRRRPCDRLVMTMPLRILASSTRSYSVLMGKNRSRTMILDLMGPDLEHSRLWCCTERSWEMRLLGAPLLRTGGTYESCVPPLRCYCDVREGRLR